MQEDSAAPADTDVAPRIQIVADIISTTRRPLSSAGGNRQANAARRPPSSSASRPSTAQGAAQALVDASTSGGGGNGSASAGGTAAAAAAAADHGAASEGLPSPSAFRAKFDRFRSAPGFQDDEVNAWADASIQNSSVERAVYHGPSNGVADRNRSRPGTAQLPALPPRELSPMRCSSASHALDRRSPVRLAVMAGQVGGRPAALPSLNLTTTSSSSNGGGGGNASSRRVRSPVHSPSSHPVRGLTPLGGRPASGNTRRAAENGRPGSGVAPSSAKKGAWAEGDGPLRGVALQELLSSTVKSLSATMGNEWSLQTNEAGNALFGEKLLQGALGPEVLRNQHHMQEAEIVHLYRILYLYSIGFFAAIQQPCARAVHRDVLFQNVSKAYAQLWDQALLVTFSSEMAMVMRDKSDAERQLHSLRNMMADEQAGRVELEERLHQFVRGNIDSMLAYRLVKSKADSLDGEVAMLSLTNDQLGLKLAQREVTEMKLKEQVADVHTKLDEVQGYSVQGQQHVSRLKQALTEQQGLVVRKHIQVMELQKVLTEMTRQKIQLTHVSEDAAEAQQDVSKTLQEVERKLADKSVAYQLLHADYLVKMHELDMFRNGEKERDNSIMEMVVKARDAEARAEEARQRAELYRLHWEERQAYVTEMEASTLRLTERNRELVASYWPIMARLKDAEAAAKAAAEETASVKAQHARDTVDMTAMRVELQKASVYAEKVREMEAVRQEANSKFSEGVLACIHPDAITAKLYISANRMRILDLSTQLSSLVDAMANNNMTLKTFRVDNVKLRERIKMLERQLFDTKQLLKASTATVAAYSRPGTAESSALLNSWGFSLASAGPSDAFAVPAADLLHQASAISAVAGGTGGTGGGTGNFLRVGSPDLTTRLFHAGGTGARVSSFDGAGGTGARVSNFDGAGGTGARVSNFDGAGGSGARVSNFDGAGGTGARVSNFDGTGHRSSIAGGGGSGALLLGEGAPGGGGVGEAADGEGELILRQTKQGLMLMSRNNSGRNSAVGGGSRSGGGGGGGGGTRGGKPKLAYTEYPDLLEQLEVMRLAQLDSRNLIAELTADADLANKNVKRVETWLQAVTGVVNDLSVKCNIHLSEDPDAPAEILSTVACNLSISHGHLGRVAKAVAEPGALLIKLDVVWETLEANVQRLLEYSKWMLTRKKQLLEFGDLHERVNLLTAQLAAANTELEELRPAYAAVKSRVENTDSIVSAADAKAQAAAVTVEQALAAQTAMEVKMQKLREEAQDAQEAKARLETVYWGAKTTSLEAELATGALVAARRQAEEDLAGLRKQFEGVMTEMLEHRAMRKQLELDLIGAKAWIRTMEHAERNHRQVLDDLVAAQKAGQEAGHALRAAQDHARMLESQLQIANIEVAAGRSQCEALLRDLAHERDGGTAVLAAAQAQRQRDVALLQQKGAALEAQARAQGERVTNLEARLADADAALATTRAQCAALERQVETLAQEGKALSQAAAVGGQETTLADAVARLARAEERVKALEQDLASATAIATAHATSAATQQGLLDSAQAAAAAEATAARHASLEASSCLADARRAAEWSAQEAAHERHDSREMVARIARLEELLAEARKVSEGFQTKVWQLDVELRHQRGETNMVLAELVDTRFQPQTNDTTSKFAALQEDPAVHSVMSPKRRPAQAAAAAAEPAAATSARHGLAEDGVPPSPPMPLDATVTAPAI